MDGFQSIASVLLLLFVTMFATVMAQEDGEKAGIHYIMFKMDEELMVISLFLSMIAVFEWIFGVSSLFNVSCGFS